MAPDPLPVPAPLAAAAGGPPVSRVRRRRLFAAACVLPVVAAGLGARFLGEGLPADLSGGIIYAVLIYVLATFLRPRASGRSNAAAALACCVLVELLQLTGIPLRLAEVFPPVRLALGSTFAPLDLLAYLAGTALALGADLAARRLRRTRGD